MCQSRLGHLHPFVVQARPLGSDTSLDLIEVFPRLFTLMQGGMCTCHFSPVAFTVPTDPAVSWHSYLVGLDGGVVRANVMCRESIINE